eukprot:2213506-Heterocapsa_arctica.AAC.1
MRHEHHAILQAERAKHNAVLQEMEEEAAHRAASAQSAVALEHQRHAQMRAETENSQAATQNQSVWEAKTSLEQQAREYQDMVNHRES